MGRTTAKCGETWGNFFFPDWDRSSKGEIFLIGCKLHPKSLISIQYSTVNDLSPFSIA